MSAMGSASRGWKVSREIVPPGILVYHVAGDLDLDTGGEHSFGAELDGVRAVVVDLTDLGFCGSTGLNALLQLRLDAVAGGLVVHLAAVPPAMARLLDVTGTQDLFPRHEDLRTALSQLS
jgi:anti-anti-sigma factor